MLDDSPNIYRFTSNHKSDTFIERILDPKQGNTSSAGKIN